MSGLRLRNLLEDNDFCNSFLQGTNQSQDKQNLSQGLSLGWFITSNVNIISNYHDDYLTELLLNFEFLL